MKTNYLQNISIALNQTIFFSPKAWMRHSGSGKKSWLYSLASSQGDIIYFFVVCQIIQENHNRVLIQRLVTHGQLAISLLHWKRSFWIYIVFGSTKILFFVHLPLARSKGTPLLSAPNVSQTVSWPLTLTQPPPFLLGFFRKKIFRSLWPYVCYIRRCDSRNLNLSPFCDLGSKSSLLKWQPTVIIKVQPQKPHFRRSSSA